MTRRRIGGETRVLERVHLPQLRRGGVEGLVLALWTSTAHGETFWEDTPWRNPDAALDRTWQQIDGAILLTPPERAYSIVAALCRLIEQANKRLTGRYDFVPARVLYALPRQLAVCGLEDRKIDRIIELNAD